MSFGSLRRRITTSLSVLATLLLAGTHGHAQQATKTPVEHVVAPGGGLVYYIMASPPAAPSDDPKLEIMSSANQNRSFTTLLTTQPANDVKQNLEGFSHLSLSPDGKTLYFQASAWATSDAVHSLNIATKKVSFITDGSIACVVLSGRYQGDLVIQQHRYFVQGGSHDDLYLYDPTGHQIGLVAQGPDASQVCPTLRE